MPTLPTRAEDAFRLAQAHYVVEPGITQIFRVLNGEHEEESGEPVKLLEVNEDTLPLGIRPVYFRAQPPWISYPTAIIEITPEEYERLIGGDPSFRLPVGWTVDYSIEKEPVPQEAG